MVSERALTLTEAAERLGWSRRTLVRALERHGMPTIGTGRRARLDLVDLETLKTKERAKSASMIPEEPRAEARRMIEAMPVGVNMDERMRSHWKRRLGQLNRRSP